MNRNSVLSETMTMVLQTARNHTIEQIQPPYACPVVCTGMLITYADWNCVVTQAPASISEGVGLILSLNTSTTSRYAKLGKWGGVILECLVQESCVVHAQCDETCLSQHTINHSWNVRRYFERLKFCNEETDGPREIGKSLLQSCDQSDCSLQNSK